MALYLELDKKHYGLSGLIPLKRGDDWELDGKIVDRFSGYRADLDMTSMSATGYFQAASGGTVSAEVTKTDESCGKIKIRLPGELSQGVALSEVGQSIYVILNNGTDDRTVETPDMPLEILDRGFRSC